MSETKTLTVRLPVALYEKASELAKSRRQSLNKLVMEGLQTLDSQHRENRLFDDFTAIAESGVDETDMEFATEAQADVVKTG